MSEVCEYGATGKPIVDCERYKQLRTDLRQAREEIGRLAETLLKIDNYCRVNDIDLEQALNEKGGVAET